MFELAGASVEESLKYWKTNGNCEGALSECELEATELAEASAGNLLRSWGWEECELTFSLPMGRVLGNMPGWGGQVVGESSVAKMPTSNSLSKQRNAKSVSAVSGVAI